MFRYKNHFAYFMVLVFTLIVALTYYQCQGKEEMRKIRQVVYGVVENSN